MTCAGNNTIAALLAGGADPTLERHLDACASCRQLVADLGRGLSAIGTPQPITGPGAATGLLPRPGDSIGRYTIRRVIGAGGMGIVYEAQDTTLDRKVALKLLRPDLVEVDRAQLLAEAQAMAKLQHPNIAVVHDVGIDHGQCYVCMEYIAGQTLRDWLAERRRTWREVLAVALAAARGLAYVHARRLVHLDIKPDNVLIARDGRVVVTDFGLARVIGARLHGPRVAVGTPAYMAPEQRRGEHTDPRTDQYALCATIVEALGREVAPRHVRRALARGMAADPADRFRTVDELCGVLGRPRRSPARYIAVTAAVALAVLGTHAGREIVVRTVEHVTEHVVDRVIDHAAPGAPASRPAADRPGGAAVVLATTDRIAGAAGASSRATRFFAALRAIADTRTRAARPRASTRDGESDSSSVENLGCEDGSELVCPLAEPQCPATTVATIQSGCWTCADSETCVPRGVPRDCADGSTLHCSSPKPVCSGETVATIRGGCWHCDDPFACTQGSVVPPPRPKAPPHHPRCGDGVCDPGEDDASCPRDCCIARGSGGTSSACSSCGNGFCEAGEDHASCPSDCCELGADGSCAPVCGNGFCEIGEDHASCAHDCCETLPGGGCAPVCGNGFCESGEDPGSCPADCH